MQKIIRRMSGISVLFLAIFTICMVPTTPVAAANCKQNNVFLPRWYEGLCKPGTDELESPVAGAPTNDTGKTLGTYISKIALNIVQILLTVVGYVSLGFILFGGFKYMTQGDNSSGTVAARKTIQNAVIGLLISILSVAIVKFVVGIV